MRSLWASSERAFSSEPTERAASTCRPAETKLDAILEITSGTCATSFHLRSFKLRASIADIHVAITEPQTQSSTNSDPGLFHGCCGPMNVS